ncbi:nucleotidyltransferase family protein [Burkholderia sp. MSMB1835]|uniref:nucleotidyltransferase family protein n=1 Tax=Burkholderia sp. MSMB1835 TaxID=1637876 RepID=UPI000A9C3DD3|nr:nucleotidyltransferase family protein [Burkholderia sp. MSMB1835]
MNAMLPCLILAGGLGTRLRPVLGDALPKALASIDGEPFLGWMLRGLQQQGVTEVVLSLGYGSGPIKSFVTSRDFGIAISVIEEDEPLGTGGAIVHALKAHGARDMIVMNGDTWSDLDLRALSAFHHATRPDLVVAATCVDDASRYGTLEFDATSRRLSAFREKRPARGYINAGTYVVDASKLLGFALPEKFSFEQDFLAERVGALDIRVFPEVTSFIDIGVPADYRRAQTAIPPMLETGTSEA